MKAVAPFPLSPKRIPGCIEIMPATGRLIDAGDLELIFLVERRTTQKEQQKKEHLNSSLRK
jgi:hypothetical protein